MKRLILIFSTLLLIVFCTGCSSSIVRSEESLMKEVQDTFGDTVEHISTIKDKDKCECIYKDTEYGFEFSIVSTKTDVKVNNVVVNWTQKTYTNYYSQYRDYLYDKVYDDCKNDYLTKNNELFFTIKVDSADNIDLDSIVNTIDTLHKYDTRQLFTGRLYVYDSNDDEVGEYDPDQKKILYHEDLLIENYMRIVEKDTNKKPTFVRYELIPKDELFNIDKVAFIADLNYDIDPDEGVHVYYFTIDGKEEFITSLVVKMNEDDTEYTNFKSYN